MGDESGGADPGHCPGESKGLELIVKTALSVIAVLNPDELLFAGNVVDREMMEAVQTACAKAVPPEFLPKLRLADHREISTIWRECTRKHWR